MLKKFSRDRQSVAALEFALILVPMLLLLAGVYDLSELLIIRSEVYDAAEAMAASASSLAVQSDGSTALTYDQVQQVESTIWAQIPTLASGQKVATPISITMTSVLFFPSTYVTCSWNSPVSCQYVADVAWSESYVGAGNGVNFDYTDPNTAMVNSDCSKLFVGSGNPPAVDQSDQVSATTSLSGYANVTTFRTLDIANSTALAQPSGAVADEAGVAPILAVSIQYTYRPLFSLYVTGPYTFWISAYWPVRSVNNAITASSFNFNQGAGNNITTVDPLANQFTTIVGNPTTHVPDGTDLNSNAYCVNTQLGRDPVTSSGT